VSIEQKVKEIAAAEFGIEVEIITNETTLDDLGGDSLDTVEFVMALENEFSIDIDDDTIINIDNLQGFIDLVTNLSEPDH
jgi:acyl carrier protein